MVEVLERGPLLALMRRLRRRRRWACAAEGGALAVTLAASALALALLLLMMMGGGGGSRISRAVIHGVGPSSQGVPSLRPWLLVLAILTLAAILGSAVRAVRRITLDACARAVDREIGNKTGDETGGDWVFAALSLAQEPVAPTPFVAALTAGALARARSVPPAPLFPPHRWRILRIATPISVCVLVVAVRVALAPATTRPSTNSSARNDSARDRAARPNLSRDALESIDTKGGGASAVRGRDPGGDSGRSALHIDAVELEGQREEATRALESGRVHRDAALARAAGQLAQLVAGLSGPGLDPGTAVTRLEQLARGLERARGAQAEPSGPRAGAGAGAAKVGGSAAAATAAVGNPIASTTIPTRRADADPEQRRRLEQNERDPTFDPDDDGAAADHQNSTALPRPRRRLERLQRELEPEQDDAERETSAERQLVANAARELIERIRRGEVDRRALGSSDELRRFEQVARGASASGAPQVGREPGDRTNPSSGQSQRQGPRPSEPPEDPEHANDSQPTSAGTAREVGSGGDVEMGAPARGGRTVAGGIGSESGGAPLGARTPFGSRSGHQIAAAVEENSAGPSRAQTIGTAAARGFATASYRRVFDDYHVAVEESLDVTEIPVGQRRLVRRYFQLIRPRDAE